MATLRLVGQDLAPPLDGALGIEYHPLSRRMHFIILYNRIR